jgi:carbon-monoxide dehydrogenase medium subunit
MIPQNFEYSAPANLKEALALLADGAKPLAGGMSLIPLMKFRFANPEHLVYIGRLAELNYIRRENGALHVGAATTHHQVESSSEIRASCPLLAEAAGHIGDMQVRNMGTIGGSAAHADPAADYPAALLALEAKVVAVSAKGEREIPIDQFFIDAFTTALEPGEIIREFILPTDAAETRVSYQKCVHPASGYAVVGVAVRTRRVDGNIALARVGVTGLAAIAFRAKNVEQALEGTAGTRDDVKKATALVADGIDANSDLYASAEYRANLARVYMGRALAGVV